MNFLANMISPNPMTQTQNLGRALNPMNHLNPMKALNPFSMFGSDKPNYGGNFFQNHPDFFTQRPNFAANHPNFLANHPKIAENNPQIAQYWQQPQQAQMPDWNQGQTQAQGSAPFQQAPNGGFMGNHQLGKRDMNYAGGSPIFDERTGTYRGQNLYG